MANLAFWTMSVANGQAYKIGRIRDLPASGDQAAAKVIQMNFILDKSTFSDAQEGGSRTPNVTVLFG